MWPENWPVLRLFASLATQWRVGFNGPVGLDYQALNGWSGRRLLAGIPRADWDALFADLQIMELAALETMRKRE